jgi:hypothetical protein
MITNINAYKSYTLSTVVIWCANSNSEIYKDPTSLAEVGDWWREMLKQNLALIALPETSPGADCHPSKCSKI